MKTSLVAALFLSLTLTTTAQQTQPLHAAAAQVKQQVALLKRSAKITVIPVSGPEEFGRLASSDSQSFTFDDVDRNSQVTLRYEDVNQLKLGWRRPSQQTHSGAKRTIIAIAIGLGVFVGLLLVAAHSLSKS
jgi:hypothetical protein